MSSSVKLTIPLTTTMPLMADVRLIHAGSVDRSALEDSVELSSGIISAKYQYESYPYWEKAFVPRLPWRKSTRDELDMLCGSWEDVRPGAWVQLFSFPQRVYAAFENIRDASVKAASEKELRMLQEAPECQEAIKATLRFASTLVVQETCIKEGNVFFNLPNLPTTSNQEDPILLGIHTDTICSVPLKYRPYSLNRLCLNLGLHDRYLLFVNLGLSRIERMLRERHIEYQEIRGTSALLAFRTAFMSTFSDYPVVKLRLKPGQGYIAPTENVIHDGCSVGQEAFDITFQAHGHFRPIID